MRVRIFLAIAFLAAILHLPPLHAAADKSGDSSDTGGISADLVDARIKEVEASTSYAEEDKKALIEIYRKTLRSLEAVRSNTEAAEAFAKSREVAPPETEKITNRLDAARKKNEEVSLTVDASTPLDDVEQLLLTEKANLAAIQAKRSEFSQQLDRENSRPGEIRQRLDELKSKSDKKTDTGSDSKADAESADMAEARKWLSDARARAQTAEINMLDQELLSQPARVALLKARIEDAEYSAERASTRVQLLEELVNESRRAEAEQVLAESEADVDKLATIDTSPLVQQLAEKNALLSEQLRKMTDTLQSVTAQTQAARQRAARIEEDYKATQKKLEVAGLNQALGLVLLEHRRDLPNLRKSRKQEKQRNRTISESALLQIQLNEEHKRIRDTEAFVDAMLATTPEEEDPQVREDLLDLTGKRLDLIEKTLTQTDAYLRALGELDFAQKQLAGSTKKYEAFLSERLLWVRSAPAPSLAMLAHFPEQLGQLLSPYQWLETLNLLAYEVGTSVPGLLGVLVVLLLLWQSGRMHSTLVKLAPRIASPRTDKFRYTFQAVALTLLLALPWPLLAFILGTELDTSSEIDKQHFAKSIAHGLLVLAPTFFFVLAFLKMCIPNGLAHAHFRWPLDSLNALRKEFRRLAYVFLPAGFIAIVISHHGGASAVTIDGGLGRLAFAVMVISLSVFFYKLFGPDKETLQDFMAKYPDSALSRFRYLWLALSLAVPILLVVLAVAGYLYTAGQLTENLIWTLWATLAYIIAQQLVVRWLLMTRRNMAYQAALEERQAQQDQQLEAEAESVDSDASVFEVEEPEVDLNALSEASTKLLNLLMAVLYISALVMIWADELPALGIFDNVTLWHQTGTEGGEATQIPVTLTDLILAIVVVAVTLIAAGRFPALLEIILLNRPSVSAGGRYTATTLTRYTIIAVGVLVALNTIGARWSQVQWLAAALSVGIGFGLQEIVANFISGLIILFERPIRVGDVVTIGETDGVITRIQIRATTMRTWDRQELLVPNKEFITGRLLNWSLSDEISRLKVPVGIAYGSDVELAMKLMQEIAEENTNVMEDPAPYIVFDSFGDNSLMLELRCFVDVDVRLSTRTALLRAINDKFNEAGISISFPQRDIHLDTLQPLDIRIQRDGKTS